MKLRHVVNTKRKFGEAGCYYYAKVTLPNGVKKDALFLESSVDDALFFLAPNHCERMYNNERERS